MPVQSMLQRGIEEPPSETTVRGAHEGFVESLETNASLLRKRLPSPDLCMESFILGSQIPSELKMFYLRSRAEPSLLEEVRSRLQKLQTKDVLSSGEVEQWIEDAPWSVFPTIGNTEKPDKAAAQILEGRVVLLLDGDPTALFMPHLFIESIVNTEDYTSRPYYVSFIRLLRTMSYFFSILLPAYYIAMLNFHKEMIPTALLPKLQESSAKAPFPITLEILIMILMFEIVREAGIRLPKSVGSAVSIVGALILGQVSVDAGIVSPPTIIVVAFSAITGFTLTPVADVIALLRIANIIVASFLGLYGVILFMLGVLVHVVSLTSFHSPFLSPIAPLYLQDWKDGFVKFPIRWLSRNPRSLHDRQRVGWKK
ncbi:spore germination protein KA [Alicyclobacillus tengchongensis]|nr:spore germination protein KA [Alicyclobacillus tengchongensis]